MAELVTSIVHVGNVLDILPTLEAGSVNCVVTSPPYWGLRDYGTATWEGGDAGCDHRRAPSGIRNTGRDRAASGGMFHDSPLAEPTLGDPYRDTCGKCGARRIDSQLGLEPTPDCGRRDKFRLRSDLTNDQREYVVRRLAGVERSDV